MAGRLTPIGVFTKWLVAPMALVALGYFVVGPRFGGEVAQKVDALKSSAASKSPESPSPSSSTEAGGYPAPDVSVSGHRVGSPAELGGNPSAAFGDAEQPKPRRHRRRHKREEPRQEAPKEPKPDRSADQPPSEDGSNDLPPAVNDDGGGGDVSGTDGG